MKETGPGLRSRKPSIVTIGSKVDAYIGDATIIAGSDASDAVSVQADLYTDIHGKAWGGQAGGIAIGLVYWGMLSLFEQMGRYEMLPPMLAAWGPNLLFGAGGLYLFLTSRT